MEKLTNEIGQEVLSRLIKYSTTIAGGLLAAFEASIIYAGLCYLAIIIDIISAWCLARRIHRQDPAKSDGKFKSSYKFRVLITIIVAQLALMLGYLVDDLVFGGGNTSQNFVIVAFLIYEGWSVAENWSSENDNKVAKAFQIIMVNKAERHFNVDGLRDVMLNDEKKDSNE